MGEDAVAAFRRPVAPCPSCGEPQHIEPLRRVGAVWFLRCLSCQFGLRMRVSAISEFRDRRQRERRATMRGGHRIADLPLQHRCNHCHALRTRVWVVTPEAFWTRCDECGRIDRIDGQRAVARRLRRTSEC
jgi:uncharacterized Zn finger protein